MTVVHNRLCISCLQTQPDYLFLSTWNEHIAQPQTLTVPPYVSMGLESDPNAAKLGFVGETCCRFLPWRLLPPAHLGWWMASSSTDRAALLAGVTQESRLRPGGRLPATIKRHQH